MQRRENPYIIFLWNTRDQVMKAWRGVPTQRLPEVGKDTACSLGRHRTDTAAVVFEVSIWGSEVKDHNKEQKLSLSPEQ
jgi:hypothetical protein